jgi:hypothetical protein
LLEETKRRASENRRMAMQLLERFMSDVAKLRPASSKDDERAAG